MTNRDLLTQGYNTLFYAEVQTPLLDAVVLLGHALGTTKEKLLAALPDPADPSAAERFRAFVDLRCSGVPVSYIRRVKEFYGLEFYVDERVLVPRPDTEVLVEKVLQVVRADPAVRRVHDACTGSGCIAVSLKHAVPELELSASDISGDALEVAALNAERILGSRLPSFSSDLLDSVPGPFDLIASNPPYLRDDEVEGLRKLGWREPELALAGGRDGTSLAQRLIRDAPSRLGPGGWLMLEAAPQQINKLYAFMDQAGFRTIDVEKDLAGSSRVIAGRLPAAVRGPSAFLAQDRAPSAEDLHG
ncbi:MAG TPA: peptide chain release factor N(5)-glutamine methyltransferase [Spirochaetia bacterium]|nr:peptide chain release factor N(5)-glutamine methyltransferase [Spirochaetia bacterium]HTZ50913.1 peptide chain release factor N(5)-glutamine methyltransferase [Spirochaetia bacterium]